MIQFESRGYPFFNRSLFLFSRQSIACDKDYLGYNISNNQAEYQGLINGLDYMARQHMTCNSLYVRGDSMLVIRQMEGRFQVKNNNIKPYYNEAQESLERLDCARTTFKFVSRERNCVADELANEAIQNG